MYVAAVCRVYDLHVDIYDLHEERPERARTCDVVPRTASADTAHHSRVENSRGIVRLFDRIDQQIVASL